jgi:hypothetical protein
VLNIFITAAGVVALAGTVAFIAGVVVGYIGSI